MKFVAPQIINLFFNVDMKYARHFYRVAGSIYSIFAQRYPDLTQKYFTRSMFASASLVTMTGKELQLKLANLHLVFVTSTEPSWSTLSQMPKEIVYLIFDVYLNLKSKINCKSTSDLCEDLLKLYFRMMPNTKDQSVIAYLVDLLKYGLVKNETTYKFDFEGYEDSPEVDSQEKCVLSRRDANEAAEEITLKMVEIRCKTLLDLVKKINDPNLEIQLMFFLFEQLGIYYETKEPKSSSETHETTDKTLLLVEEKLTRVEVEINLKIVYFTQLSYLFESIDPQLIIASHEKIIDFCETVLKSILNLLRDDTTTLVSSESEYETIHLILSIVSVYTTGFVEIDYEVKKNLQLLLPLLSELKLFYKQSEIETMLDSLCVSIATYCGIKTNNSQTSKNRVLIEEVESDEILSKGSPS